MLESDWSFNLLLKLSLLGCNNVTSSLLRQYGIGNVLYIDDRAIVCEQNDDYISWLVSSLSTSTGHYLSMDKSNLDRAQTVFIYLGIGKFLFFY